MRRLIAATLLSLAVTALASDAQAQDARKRQAAAEAYDRGTAAYLDGSYGEAAQWFETADRMAPAAPALMQAIRSHQRAENFARAATLALRLSETYGSDAAAAEYAKNVLGDLSGQFARIDVTCDQECKLDLDGKLQEFHSFFLEPGAPHTLVASFETGSMTEEIRGQAGETHAVQFEAPPAPVAPPASVEGGSEATAGGQAAVEPKHKPLRPVITIIAVALTGALLAATVVSGIDANSGVKGWKKAVNDYNVCHGNCDALFNKADQLLKDGQSKQTRTNVLIGATAVVGVTTAVFAIFLTDWSGKPKKSAGSQGASLRIAPLYGGGMGVLEGRF
ncbi:MAG TPA: hypothetical protein VF331_11105 [Polyangiales bacterium]